LVRNLAANALTPIMFGLPREFWSMQGDSITGSYPANQGIAAYTSTNYVSAGTDFMMVLNNGYTGAARADLPYPQPAAQPNDTSLAELYAGTPAANLTAIRDGLCSGDLSTCKMRFYGSVAQPNTRKSSVSFFSQALLGGTSPQGLQARRAGYFTQNYFTYANAAADLIPKTVEYSAGLINYFFRGEMEIRLPEEGVYGIVDHAVTNAKGDGYKLLKMRVKNVTADITTAITPSRPTGVSRQDMSAGQFVAVAKFRRNTCYMPDLSGQIGQPGMSPSCRTTVEEIVVSAPGTELIGSIVSPATSLQAQEEKTFTFDFTANPLPIEATDLFVQVVFKPNAEENMTSARWIGLTSFGSTLAFWNINNDES